MFFHLAGAVKDEANPKQVDRDGCIGVCFEQLPGYVSGGIGMDIGEDDDGVWLHGFGVDNGAMGIPHKTNRGARWVRCLVAVDEPGLGRGELQVLDGNVVDVGCYAEVSRLEELKQAVQQLINLKAVFAVAIGR